MRIITETRRHGAVHVKIWFDGLFEKCLLSILIRINKFCQVDGKGLLLYNKNCVLKLKVIVNVQCIS